MRRRRCPKCRGSGNAGQISNWRCDACDARGWFDLSEWEEYTAYRKTCESLGIPVDIEEGDEGPDDFDDDLKAEEWLPED